MRNLRILPLAIALCFISIDNYATIATIPLQSTENKPLSINHLMSMSIKDIESTVGYRLSFKQKISIRLAKYHLIKPEKSEGKSSSGAIFLAGILLGLFLPIFGIIIASAFKDKKAAIAGAIVGTLIAFLILFVFLSHFHLELGPL